MLFIPWALWNSWVEIVNYRLQRASVFFSVRSGPLLADNCYKLYGLGFVKFCYFYLKSLCDAYASSHMYHGAFCKHILDGVHCFSFHLMHGKCSPSTYSFHFTYWFCFSGYRVNFFKLSTIFYLPVYLRSTLN